MVHIDANDPSVARQAKAWLDACLEEHDECRRLHWSGVNPTRLIRILDGERVQIVKLADSLNVRYVALSYCWGDLNDEERTLVDRGNTWSASEERRLSPFSISEFPKTIVDAIKFTRDVGIEYIWIDAVCILRDESPNPDKTHELGLMHTYYGNALFTLSLSSTTKATEGFLRPRNAWRYMESSCSLNGYEIISIDTTLDDAREHSPLAGRAWTLQEELLSPKRIYWFAQGMYWSCAQAQWIEGVKEPKFRPTPRVAEINLVMSLEENFLLACRKDRAEVVRTEWLRSVESYAKRDIGRSVDRFAAISGIAARYHDSFQGLDQYVAGLWRSGLPEHLGWRVVSLADRDGCDDVLKSIPSWSWAALPMKTMIWTHPKRFSSIYEPSTNDLELKLDSLPVQNPKWHADEAVHQGSLIKSIKVKGRLRPFWSDTSTLKPWKEVFVINKQGTEVLSDDFSVDDSVHAIHTSDGRMVVTGNRKDEVYGHLDFVQDIERAFSGSLEVNCLQLSSSSMLLLEQCGDMIYRRVGVSRNFWPGFFARFDLVEVTL
ncbi:HET-domain-containing protein, partial [Microthyrium microscopicum]